MWSEGKVPDTLGTIFIRMPTMQERSMRGFLLEGVGILAVLYLEAVITSLLAKPLPMDSDTSELWRALGRDDFSTLHILHLLLKKIQYPAGSEGSSSEGTAPLGPHAAFYGDPGLRYRKGPGGERGCRALQSGNLATT
ncbi:hypothetical protein Y1Q_0020673 [Alligator mississippiensis]|uniref:Maestro-like HEAT-repeats domain-containing protein n=1 Tax=Alligator mississippiensis TaxID=8496 RepID=A0A151MS78_ALLMI|nr:hypothetical protein Y1Q_0020673 [Alligator mississippiensis]